MKLLTITTDKATSINSLKLFSLEIQRVQYVLKFLNQRFINYFSVSSSYAAVKIIFSVNHELLGKVMNAVLLVFGVLLNVAALLNSRYVVFLLLLVIALLVALLYLTTSLHHLFI